MSIATTRAKFIRETMMDIAVREGIEKGSEFFNKVYDFISFVDRGDGSIPPEVITTENRIALEVYSRVVKRWIGCRDKKREEYLNKERRGQ